MITIRFSGRRPSPECIEMGQETDSGAERIRFLLPQIGENQIATVQMILPDGKAEAVLIEDNMITVPARLTEIAGRSRAWVEILADGVAWHSELFYLDVGELPPISERTEQEYPTVFQEAIARSETAKRQAEIAAAIAKSAQGNVTVEINGDGDLIVTYEDTEGETHEANLGPVSAYTVAKKYGYTGTEQEWEEAIASVGEKSDAAAQSAEDAADAALSAEVERIAAQAANTAAQAAKTAAETAQAAAETAAARDTAAWLEENITNPDSPPLDRTLSYNTAAAPADLVGDIMSTIDEAEDNIYIKAADTSLWESGSINGSTGEEASNGKRIRTGALPANVAAFSVAAGFSVLIYAFDGDTYLGTYNDGSYVKSTSTSQLKYYEGKFPLYKLPQTYTFRLVAKENAGASVSVSDAANILFWTSADKAQDAKISAIETGLTNAVAKFGNYSSLISADAASISGTEENPADFDRLLDPGDYKVTSVSAAAHVNNMPDAVAGRLLVMQTSQAAKILQVYVANNAAKATIYTRLYNNGAWTAWYNVSPAYDETPTAGSTRPVTSGGIYAALQNVLSSEIVNIPSHLSALGTALTYRLPSMMRAGETYINDTTVTDGIAANITQGICSDGERYLYYNLAPMGDNGHGVLQRIRKWDTWTNTSAGLSEPYDWGHCEDTCFVPAWCPGFDNGNVDRLYTTDFNYSESTPEGYYIHVIDANTLEPITSFRTDTLLDSEYWVGAMHLVFNQERGLFCLKCGFKIDGVNKYWCFAVFNSSGTLLRAARVRMAGTGFGFDCDENYIYPVRYVSGGLYYGYVIDWDLHPIARFALEKADWEFEGVCHIGSDVYVSYNQELKSGVERKNTNTRTKPIYDYYDANGTPIASWPKSDGVKWEQWTPIDVE